jgi:hypothetical protein
VATLGGDEAHGGGHDDIDDAPGSVPRAPRPSGPAGCGAGGCVGGRDHDDAPAERTDHDDAAAGGADGDGVREPEGEALRP